MTRVKCGGLLFMSDFDSGNLAKVETVTAVSSRDLSGNSSSNSHGRTTRSNSASTNSQVKSQYPFPPKSRVKGVLAAKQITSSDIVKKKVLPKDKIKSSLFNKPKIIDKKPPVRKGYEKILEFKVWTKPDCAGTAYENGNRTWFHFGVKGGFPGSIIKIHVMNLNRQGKLYHHGMTPVFKIVPAKEGWKRIPGKVKYKNSDDGNFIITFSHAFPTEPDAVIYFAFAYPFSYSECQQMLDDIDRRIGSSLHHSLSSDQDMPVSNSIYYCRELLCYSLEGLKVELLTVSSFKGLTSDREPRLPHLFPDDSKPRCHIFHGKKVVFISGRVHPGETPSSFVFNGLLHFLLCGQDEKAIQLRHQFVFKLIPMLNPDGVFHGHYRTDTQGLNLNRVYLTANPQEHPSIYAARTLLLHYHVSYSSSTSIFPLSVPPEQENFQHNEDLSGHMSVSPDLKCTYCLSNSLSELNSGKQSEDVSLLSSEAQGGSSSPSEKKVSFNDYIVHLSDDRKDELNSAQTDKDETKYSKFLNSDKSNCDLSDISNCSFDHGDNEKKHNLGFISNISAGSAIRNHSSSESLVNDIWESLQDLCKDVELGTISFSKKLQKSNVEKENSKSNSELEASDADEEISTSSLIDILPKDKKKHKKLMFLPKMKVPLLSPEESGIAFYVDLHGHASKRGCFLYGNFFVNLDQKVECMLLAKLMSINSPHFDFSACNFSVQNMYQGGGKEGQSKEGSGRVALYTLTGIIHSYTLECNYNSSRSMVVIPPTEVSGSTSWTGNKLLHYTPEIYHQVGRALLISMLDSVDLNPSSRVVCSTCHSLAGVREWLKKHISMSNIKDSAVSFKDRHHSWTAGVSTEKLQSPKEKNIAADSRRATIHYVSPRIKVIAPKLASALRVNAKCKKNFISPWDPPLSNRQLLAKFERNANNTLHLKSSLKLPGLLQGVHTLLDNSTSKPFSKTFVSSQTTKHKTDLSKNLIKDAHFKSGRHDRTKEQKVQLSAKSRLTQKSTLIKSNSLEKMSKQPKTKVSSQIQGMKSLKVAGTKIKQKFPLTKSQDTQELGILHKPENLGSKAQLPKNSLNVCSAITQPTTSGRRRVKRQSPTYKYMAFSKAYLKSKTKDKP